MKRIINQEKIREYIKNIEERINYFDELWLKNYDLALFYYNNGKKWKKELDLQRTYLYPMSELFVDDVIIKTKKETIFK